MAHPEQMGFIEGISKLCGEAFRHSHVLEVGSRDINGSVRRYFVEPASYVGVDAAEGKGVDIVGCIHDIDSKRLGRPFFDVVICCEVLEHDPYWEMTLRACLGRVDRGGLFILTYASPERPEHGTRRSDGNAYGPNPDYYLSPPITEVLTECRRRLRTVYYRHLPAAGDYHIWGIM